MNAALKIPVYDSICHPNSRCCLILSYNLIHNHESNFVRYLLERHSFLVLPYRYEVQRLKLLSFITMGKTRPHPDEDTTQDTINKPRISRQLKSLSIRRPTTSLSSKRATSGEVARGNIAKIRSAPETSILVSEHRWDVCNEPHTSRLTDFALATASESWGPCLYDLDLESRDEEDEKYITSVCAVLHPFPFTSLHLISYPSDSCRPTSTFLILLIVSFLFSTNCYSIVHRILYHSL